MPWTIVICPFVHLATNFALVSLCVRRQNAACHHFKHSLPTPHPPRPGCHLPRSSGSRIHRDEVEIPAQMLWCVGSRWSTARMGCWMEKGIHSPASVAVWFQLLFVCNNWAYRLAIIHFHLFSSRFIPDTQISFPPRSLSFTVIIVNGNCLKDMRDRFDHKGWVCPDNEHFPVRSSDF